MTRSEHSIEHEIDVARTDLEANLGELKASVKAKLDIKRRVRDAVDRKAYRASMFVDRMTHKVREHRALVIGAAVAVLGLTTIALIAYNRRA
jgi:hypothetical protein